jgi:hypothetical protein
MSPALERLALKLVIGLGCVLLLALLVQDRNRWKAKTAHYAELLAGERAAHSATVANYRAAVEQARRTDAANAARVKAEQAVINETSKHDYQSRIVAARTAAQRLRGNRAAAADPRRGGATPVPGLPGAAGRAAEAAGDHRLSDQERLTATEQAIQLDALIEWVEAQGRVRTGGAGD